MEASVPSRLHAWIIAARLHTLPAGISPVLVGIGLAGADGVFAPLPAGAALVGALLIQIGTNFVNDYTDALRGADSADRDGFTRVTAAGLIDVETIKVAAFATFAAALLVGCYLVYVGGAPIVVVGLVSIASGYAYTGGPLPFGYRGLGDLFVFVFFGLVAVTGTYYVQAAAVLADPLTVTIPAGTVTIEAVMGGIAMGALTTAILVVNNLRDIEDDRDAGKRTLAVILGPAGTRVEFVGLLLVAYTVPVYFILEGTTRVGAVYFSLPLAILVTTRVFQPRDGERLNRTLSKTGQLTLLFAVLFTAGVWV